MLTSPVPAHSRAWANSLSRAKPSSSRRHGRCRAKPVVHASSRGRLGREAVVVDRAAAHLAGAVGPCVQPPQGSFDIGELRLGSIEHPEVLEVSSVHGTDRTGTTTSQGGAPQPVTGEARPAANG